MNIQPLRTLFFALFLLLSLSAKSQCAYTLEMLDSYGDGWNGGVLTINTGGVITTYTLNNIDDDGIDSTLMFNIIAGAPLIISYTTGSFTSEVSFNIYDNTGGLFLSRVAPTTGSIYNGIGACIACGEPLNFAVENVWDNRARLRWQANNLGTSPALNWRVIYGLQGFTPGAGVGDTLTVNIPKVNIQGLQKKTWYDAYVEQYCDVAGGYSKLVGPISFQTYWTNDMGISGVVAPASGCDLGLDSLKVILANYGSAPQSLFTFSYSVNGEPANVVPPSDGFYTGILGKDSSTVFAFETLTDFSNPGEYRIDIFTELSNDEDVSNDTFTYYLTNRLQPEYLQQFEVWNGGWTPGGTNPSWEFGIPNKPSIPAAASGLNAWVTSLTGSYNVSENSYLESPCFDFSQLSADPAIEISINRSMQQDFDGSWLEMSLDGGQNWEKVGEVGEGKNWYTGNIDFLGLTDAWSGNSDGWVNARHSLPNSAGESEVHLRFAFASSPFFNGGGFGVDDVHILASLSKDLGGLSMSTLGEVAECGLENDQIIFNFVNLGNQPQSGYKIGYSINGATPVVQNVTGTLLADQNRTQTFSVPFDSRDGLFEIKCWTILPGDQNLSNDTITYSISHVANQVPYHENFEAYTFPPETWTYDPSFGFSVTDAHNNLSKVLAFNLYSGNTSFTADMPRMGPVHQGDSLNFAYRITNFATQGQTAAVLSLGTKIEVQISTDCGTTYETINTISFSNHTPTVQLRVRKLSLDAYAGQAIKVRFKGTWGAGDLWIDFDNINILSCAGNMALSADIVPATPGFSDGQATVNVGLGNPPYQYQWSDGQTSETATNLAVGAYTVTVLDAFGCSDTLSLNLGSSGTSNLDGFATIALFPNPTSGLTLLQASFEHPMEAQIELINPLGQRIWAISTADTDALSQPIDLSHFPNGLYLVRIAGEGKMLVRKLVKE